jgi:hypothetical protein
MLNAATIRDNRRSDTTILSDWTGSAGREESTLHQLSPYIGKLKSSIAASLVAQFSGEGDLLYDPFAGCGTVALEAWAAGRRVIANDLSPYASVLTKAKLFPYRCLKDALADIRSIDCEAILFRQQIDLRKVPTWVRRFFHSETLRDAIAWTTILRRRRRWFLLASLLGILHHQRPGFLSFPSSHTVPYLRVNKFPRSDFPELYEYRTLRDRLEAKVQRAFRRIPDLDFDVNRNCISKNAGTYVPTEGVDAIITSPPYMRLLDYARDNRLRLWFLGVNDWRGLDQIVSPREEAFLKLMRRCFTTWKSVLKPNRYCVLIVGDTWSRLRKENLPQVVRRLATEEIGGFSLVCEYSESIPNERRVRRGSAGSTSETVVVLQNLG